MLNASEKDIELQVEKLKLEDTKRIINEEILNYVERRKKITEYIVDYRKNVIDEYRNDEDKIIEYFDHERFVKEEAFKTIDRRLKELTILLSNPYFGKVNFVEEGYGAEEYIYIGKFGVTPEGSYEPVIVDWRAPIASLFYTGGLGKATYESPNGAVDTEILGRRQFIIKKGELTGMFDSAIDVKDEILQMVLSSNSGDKLKDIIMTIQKEQDEIIRRPRNEVVVVNGVAGSGKTTIALHRVAYLLYNYRRQLEDKVLILGPNGIFMEYISRVLPSLGESGIKQSTFRDFAIRLLNLKEPVMEFQDYIERVLGDDKELIENVRYKSSKEYKDFLNKNIEELNESYFNIQDLLFRDEVIVSAEEIKDMFFNHYAYMPLFRRSARIKRVLISRIKDKRDEYFRELQQRYRKLKEELKGEDKVIEENNLEFTRRIEIRELIREVMKVKASISWIEHEDIEEIYGKINGNKPLILEDLAPMLYIKLKLEDIKLKEEIKHVVIDEAQDYSDLQFEVIKDITKCQSFTIVGDSNQRLISFEERPAMVRLEEVLGEALNVKYFALNKSYRSTNEIMEYANRYLEEDKVIPFVREGKAVDQVKVHSKEDLGEKVRETVEAFKEEGYESIAIICRNKEMIRKIEMDIKQKQLISTMDSEDIIYKGGVVLIPSYFAKGLEFDGAIIVDDEEKDGEDLIKYIMCTRALHGLKEFELDCK